MNPHSGKKIKKYRTFEERLLNKYEQEHRHKEKLLFTMYLNIKNRYKNDPEKLVRIYKLYFN